MGKTSKQKNLLLVYHRQRKNGRGEMENPAEKNRFLLERILGAACNRLGGML